MRPPLGDAESGPAAADVRSGRHRAANPRSRARAAWLAALGLVLPAGCARNPPPPPPAPVFEGLSIELTPEPDRSEVEIDVRLAGPAAVGVDRVGIARDWAGTRGADAVRGLRATDTLGEIALEPVGGSSDAEADLRLTRPARGELRLAYRAHDAGPDAPRMALHVDRDRVAGVGHAFLVLPRVLAPVPARVRWHPAALGPGASGASSLGSGDTVLLEATSDALAHAVYAAGLVGAVEAAPVGAGAPPPLRLVHVGAPSLDPSSLLAWTAGARIAARAVLDPGATAPADPLTLLLCASPGMGRDHEGVSLGGALGLWLDPERALDAGVKIVVAHELVHEWIGGSLRLEHEGRDLAWFSEGFTVHYARRVLFDAGLLTPDELLADLRRTTEPGDAPGRAGAASGAGAHEQVAALWGHERGDGYRRGALYAAKLEAALRARPRRPAGARARGLDDLLRELAAEARAKGGGPLSVASFRALVVRELGAAAGDELDRLMLRGEGAVVPPQGAFGPCFRRVVDEVTVFDLGFDPESLGATPQLVRGLRPGSAAARAGVRAGALVLASKLPAMDGDRPRGEVKLTLADRRGGRKVHYRPEAKRARTRWELAACDRVR